MIRPEDLRTSPRPGEAVFTWQHPETGALRCWAVERLAAWLRSVDWPVCKAEIDVQRAKWYMTNRGIESHRVVRLAESPDHLIAPQIFMRMGPESTEENPTDLCLDGHHRYVALAMLDQEFYPLWHITEVEAAPFEVAIPQPPPGAVLNVSAPSGF